MANDLQQTLERLNRKSLNLIERYQSVLQAKQAAEKRIIELETPTTPCATALRHSSVKWNTCQS